MGVVGNDDIFNIQQSVAQPAKSEITQTQEQKNIQSLTHNVFINSSPAEVKEIYARMEAFAEESGMDITRFVESMARGKKLLDQIAMGEVKSAYSTKEFIDAYTFILGQAIKAGAGHHYGTIKFPDPGNAFATLAMNTLSTYHGQVITPRKGELPKPKGRWSSHFPEKTPVIKKTPIQLTDKSWACFSNKSAEKLLSEGVEKSKIRNVGMPALCIDASGPDIRIPGKNKNTFLVQCFPEKDAKGEEVATIAIKAEGFSAVAVGEKGYGKAADRLSDTIKHGGQWVKKKGPKAFQKKVSTETQFRDFKEDKLSETVKTLLSSVTLLEGKKNGSEQEKALHQSYQELSQTTQMGSEYGLQELKSHLLVQLPVLTEKTSQLRKTFLKTHSKSTFDALNENEKQREATKSLLKEIAQTEKSVQNLGKDWSHYLLPRSEEVILPSIHEMVEDKVAFQSSAIEESLSPTAAEAASKLAGNLRKV